jgi:hypothetical protein
MQQKRQQREQLTKPLSVRSPGKEVYGIFIHDNFSYPISIFNAYVGNEEKL